MSYISSNANRFYCGIESSYGQVPAILAKNRFAGVKLMAKQQTELAARKDKTGSRTYPGAPNGGRKKTEFELKTYLAGWNDTSQLPGFAPLFQAALGAAPLFYTGGVAGTGSTVSQIVFAAPHGLRVGQAVSWSGEIRFVISLPDSSTALLNAPFSVAPGAGVHMAPTVTFLPGAEMQSVSLFDYWSPATAVQRVLCGAAVDKLSLSIDGDFHEFEFKGLAQDVLDSSTFAAGSGQLSAFPTEPGLAVFPQSAVPANLGQAWLGTTAQQFATVTKASAEIDNNLDLRAKEFGTKVPMMISPGPRSVSLDFSLFEQNDAATVELYQAARQHSPITAMLQLGEQAGQLCGFYLPSVVPELPEFDDSERRLQWRFRNSRAQGTSDDEVAVAFA